MGDDWTWAEFARQIGETVDISDLSDDELRSRLTNRGWTPRAASLAVRNREAGHVERMIVAALSGKDFDVSEEDFV